MKKIFIFSLLCLYAHAVCAQLRVTPDGKVAIGTTLTPIINLAVGTEGYPFFTSYIQGNTSNVSAIWATGSHSNAWGAALVLQSDVRSSTGDMGIYIRTLNDSPLNSGRSIGLTARAGNAKSGYNYAVIGSLEGSNNGTAILGTTSGIGAHQGIYIDAKYSGYFDGNVKVTGTINGTVVGASDLRLKQNVTDLGDSGRGSVLKSVANLNPVSYNYRQVYHEVKTDSTDQRIEMFDEKSDIFQKTHFGLIAQELQKVYPDLVYENDNGFLSINYTELIPLLIQSIKELKEEVDQLSMSARSATASERINDLPRAVLYQNAPNPFTERTEIKFELPGNTGNAFIYIFNLQGLLIKQITVNKFQSSVTINGSELAAGMYMYTLIADGKEIDTKKMILTK